MLTITPEQALQGRSWAIVSDWGVYDLYREQVVAESICRDLNKRYGSDKYAVAHIEQPTCELIPTRDKPRSKTPTLTCSECGWWTDEIMNPPNYCPNCGAKVVDA